MIDNVTTVRRGDGTISVLLHSLRQDILSLIILSGKSIAPWVESGVWYYVLWRYYPPTYDAAR